MIELLRDEYDVHVIAPQELLEVDLLARTTHLYTSWPIEWGRSATRWRSLVRLLGKYQQIRSLVSSIEPEFVLFNSTYRIIDRFLIVCLFRGIAKGQIIHEFRDFLGPGRRWTYNQFDLNLVISEQVLEHVRAHHPGFADLDYVLPIFFGGFLDVVGHSRRAPQPSDSHLKLGVFGTIENRRRNYRGFLDALWATLATHPEPRFRVYLVGRAPEWLQDEIRQHQAGHLVKAYPEYVPFQEMFTLLEEVDLVFFLIDQSVDYAQYYNRYKITGTSTLVKAFGKAAASSTAFALDKSLMERCYFYEGANLRSLLDSIGSGDLTRSDVQKKLAAAGETGYFGFEYQQQRLVGLVEQALKRRKALSI